MCYLRWLVVGVLLTMCGCARETLNVSAGIIDNWIVITGVLLDPAEPIGGYQAGTTVTATVSFVGGQSPFYFSLTFRENGATPVRQIFETTAMDGTSGIATATFTIDPFPMTDNADGRDIYFDVVGTDGNGFSSTRFDSFHVVGTTVSH